MVKKKNVSGYGQGGVDVVMSVDQVAKEAAAISAKAPKAKDLEKLSKSEPLLSIKNLKAGYGKMEILHDFNLFIGEGQSLCLIGPNGAGKSTVLHSIFGFTLVIAELNILSGSSLFFDFILSSASYKIFSAVDLFPSYIIEFINFETISEWNFGSG